MTCKCGGQRIANISAKSNDMNFININTCDGDYDGYVPRDMGIGGGDYVRFSWCLDCGRIQGDFPLAATRLEVGDE